MPKIVINPTYNPKLEKKKKSRTPILRPYYRPFFFVAVPTSLLNIFFVAFFFKYLPPVIPLFNTMSLVSDRLADKKAIFLLPIMAVTINVIHALVIYLGRKYEVLLLNIFNYFTIFIQILLLAVLLRLILVVI